MPRIHEQATLAEAAAGASVASGRFPIQVLTPGQGSSGYYSAAVCESAAALIQPGTKMYLDHPTESDQFQRPERSLRDLAAVFTEAGRWDADRQAVIAEAQVFAPYRETIAEMAPFIGVSVIGDGKITEGALPTGGRGRVVESIDRIQSVDFVTEAGRGGKVMALLESARNLKESRNIGQWIESRIHRDFTVMADDMAADGQLTREERIQLSSAIGDALAAFVSNLEADAPQLYQRDLWDDPQDTVAAAMEALRNVPVNPAGQPTTQESEEDTMPNIEESELARLREADGRVQTLESERDTAARERDEARTALAESRARETAAGRARTRVTEANATLPAATVDRIVEAATRTVPLTEAGGLDEAAFDTQVDTARTSEETYLASLAEATGAGRVTGLGLAPVPGDAEVTRNDTAVVIAEAFGRQPKTAKEA